MSTKFSRHYTVAAALAFVAAIAGSAPALAQAGVGPEFYTNDSAPNLTNGPRTYYNYVAPVHSARTHHIRKLRAD